jgi:hypothetical protein
MGGKECQAGWGQVSAQLLMITAGYEGMMQLQLLLCDDRSSLLLQYTNMLARTGLELPMSRLCADRVEKKP